METIQVVMEAALLQAADRAVRRYKVSRSALIRQAVREHLKRLERLEKERRDRDGYRGHPEANDALSVWDTVAAWPQD